MLHRARVDAAPDPAGLARALADHPGLCALCDGVGGGWAAGRRLSFVACDPDRSSDALDPWEREDATDDPRAAVVPRWIGAIPYEARRAALERPAWVVPDARPPATATRVHWWRYPAVVVVDHAAGTVEAMGRDERAVRALAAAAGRAVGPGPSSALTVIDDERAEAHIERVRAALELIRAGDLYQVNLARRLRLVAPGGLDVHAAVQLAGRLLAAAPSPFGALLTLPEATIVSTSPELLLDARAGAGGARFGALRTDPIKGTRPRRAGLARELDKDPKERAELAMIIDVERNDLGRVAVVGSVAVSSPRVVRAGRVLHRVASVSAVARPSLTGADVLASIVPSGSVTGAPKVRAMEVIASLEPVRRGHYTGGFGLMAHDGSMRLGMAIRGAVFPASRSGDGEKEGEWIVGGGIVEASDPARELEETRWKSRQLEALMGPRAPW